MSKVFDWIGNFFTRPYSISLCDPYFIQFYERDFALFENCSFDNLKSEFLLRLSWALVHSKRPEDVQHGINMLEGEKGLSVNNTNDPSLMKLKMYILAIGYYRNGDYSKSRDYVDSCLAIAHDWKKATSLKKAIEDFIKKDGMTGMYIDTTGVGIGVGVVTLVAGSKQLSFLAINE